VRFLTTKQGPFYQKNFGIHRFYNQLFNFIKIKQQ